MSSPTVAAIPGAGRRTLARLVAGLRFRDALLVTLVPVAAAGYLFAASVADYARARQFDDYWSRSITVAGAFSARARGMLALPGALAQRQRFDPEARDAGIIRLAVPAASWDTVAGDPQAMFGQWAQGTLTYGGTAIAVRVRKRGDNSVHWVTEKVSVTVRTPRDEFYKQYRSFGLSGKDVLPSYLANRLAREFGVLAPATEVVPLFLNNRFYGMYRFIEPVDESFLRPFDRMPGNIFRGDRAERGEYVKGQPRNLFENPYLWDRLAVSERPTAAGADQLRLLLDDLAGTTFEDHRRLAARFERGALARLFAYLLVAGDPWHADGVHNQLIYEDPSTARLHPIPWDTRLLELGDRPPVRSDLFRALLADPFLVDAVARELAPRLGGGGVGGRGGIARTGDSLVRAAEARYASYFAYDRARAGLIPDVGDAAAAAARLARNAERLARWLDDAATVFHVERSGTGAILDFETRGRVGVDLVGFELDRPAVGARLTRDWNLSGVGDAGDDALPLRAETPTRLMLVRHEPLLAGWSTDSAVIAPGHVPYRFFLTGLPAGATVRPVLRNRVTGAAVTAGVWEAGAAIRPATAWHPWRYPVRAPRTIRFAGTVRLTETLRTAEGDTLLIAPGTTLRLGPDVSVVARGPVFARGTAAQPIRVVPDVSALRPWGAFSLLGHGADGSVVSHVEFAEGGGALVDRIEYIGMVNVHHAARVVFDDVTFRDNVRSDDTFHALHAEVALRRCRFVRANSDAADFDVSTGEIVDTRFEGSGGDAIDLMASAPWIANVFITGAGDKGISVGEASRPVIVNTRIERSLRGIEVKDRSAPVVLHSEFTGGGVGLRERRKNWRYGDGGWATLVRSVFQDNETSRERDAFSRLTPIGVVGLDSTETGAAEPSWLYALLGLSTDGTVPGRLARWSRREPARAIAAARFVDDFGPLSDGWEMGGGATRLEKRRDALQLDVERITGSATRVVDWTVPDAGALLVIEVGGRDVTGGRLVARGETREAAVRFTVPADPNTFSVVTLDLGPGRWTEVRVEATPQPGLSHTIQRATGLSVLRAGRLALRGYTVVPRDGPGR